MTRRLIASATALAIASGWALPASAQDAAAVQQELAAMRAEMARMAQRIDTLEGQLVEARSAAQTAQASAASASQQAAAVQASVTAKPATQVSWSGAPRLTGEGGWSFKPRGRIQYDAGIVSAPGSIADKGLGFANEARRIRLGVEGTVPGGFGYKMEADFTDGNVVLTDALLDYKRGPITVNLGQHNPFQGIEELTSSNDTSFIERAAFTDAFGFERNIGVSVEYAQGDVLVQGGVFTDNLHTLSDDENSSFGFDGRLVFAPKIGKTQLHFGASGHWRDLGDSITSRRYRQRPLLHTTDTRFMDTGNMGAARSETNYGLEAAAILGRFHASGEAHWMRLGRSGLADPLFFGGAVEAGLFLTPDSREYRNGMFRAIKVARPLSKGGPGAWQVNVRYDWLDMNDAGIRGGKQDSLQASVIWTPVDQVRFMLNYGKLYYTDAAVPAAGGDRNYSVDVIGGRFQVGF